jgi:hypothetical protein
MKRCLETKPEPEGSEWRDLVPAEVKMEPQFNSLNVIDFVLFSRVD